MRDVVEAEGCIQLNTIRVVGLGVVPDRVVETGQGNVTILVVGRGVVRRVSPERGETSTITITVIPGYRGNGVRIQTGRQPSFLTWPAVHKIGAHAHHQKQSINAMTRHVNSRLISSIPMYRYEVKSIKISTGKII